MGQHTHTHTHACRNEVTKTSISQINNPWTSTLTFQDIRRHCQSKIYIYSTYFNQIHTYKKHADDPLLLHAHHAVSRQPSSAAEHCGILLGSVLRMSTLEASGEGATTNTYLKRRMTHKFFPFTYFNVLRMAANVSSALSCYMIPWWVCDERMVFLPDWYLFLCSQELVWLMQTYYCHQDLNCWNAQASESCCASSAPG